MPQRSATAKERKLWIEFNKQLDRLNAGSMALRLRSGLLGQAVAFCKARNPEGVCNYPWGSERYLSYTSGSMAKLLGQVERINNAVSLTQIGTAGIQLHPTGEDFDIVVPATTPRDIWANAAFDVNQLPGEPMGPGGEIGAGPILPLIVYGTTAIVGLVTGAIGAVVICRTIQKKYDKDIADSIQKADKTFCTDPKSPICRDWLAQRESQPFRQSEGMIDKLLGPGAGKATVAGLGIAGAVGLGLLAFMLLSKRQ